MRYPFLICLLALTLLAGGCAAGGTGAYPGPYDDDYDARGFEGWKH